jgi:two-component system chemotaxis sensor kinase CheA
MFDQELLTKLRTAFRQEAGERLHTISTDLLELERVADPEQRQPLLESVFREAHSLKGAARAVDLTGIEILCQSIESVFGTLKRGGVPVDPDLFDVLHESVSVVEDIMAETGEEEASVLDERIDSLIGKLRAIADGEPLPQPATAPANPASFASQAAAAQTASETVAAARPAEPSEATEEPEATEPSAADDRALEASASPNRSAAEETVRIPVKKLDALLLKAEEMVSLKQRSEEQLASLHTAARSLEQWQKDGTELEIDRVRSLSRTVRGIAAHGEQNQRLLAKMVDDLLDEAKKVTMLPFATLFEVFPRMVRDISRELGKEVDLDIWGGDIEIDRRILEDLKDPMIHLLRNSVDHGLESPEEREALRKDRGGRIELAVSQTEGGKVTVRLSDDGRGIDAHRLREDSVRKGVLSRREADALDDREALSLIFRSGISTSPILTEISGRGLGMAIVQERIEKLGGLLSLETERGKGTAFTIQLPVTLATLRGILVRLGDGYFIVPSHHADRVLSVPADAVLTAGNKPTVDIDGCVLSFVKLESVLELAGAAGRKDDRDRNVSIVVLGSGDRRIAFGVDEILNEQEVLVKNLGRQLKRVRNVAGATVIGSGRVVPILNVHDLLKSAVRAAAGRAVVDDCTPRETKRTGNILVVDDSITSRMLIKSILEASGYTVKTAVDGLDAFTILKTEDIDLVVSDVEMPRMTGFELAGKIRGDGALSEMPLILVTGLASREDRERGVEVGANAYIVKGEFDQSNLLDAITRLM